MPLRREREWRGRRRRRVASGTVVVVVVSAVVAVLSVGVSAAWLVRETLAGRVRGTVSLSDNNNDDDGGNVWCLLRHPVQVDDEARGGSVRMAARAHRSVDTERIVLALFQADARLAMTEAGDDATMDESVLALEACGATPPANWRTVVHAMPLSKPSAESPSEATANVKPTRLGYYSVALVRCPSAPPPNSLLSSSGEYPPHGRKPSCFVSTSSRTTYADALHWMHTTALSHPKRTSAVRIDYDLSFENGGLGWPLSAFSLDEAPLLPWTWVFVTAWTLLILLSAWQLTKLRDGTPTRLVGCLLAIEVMEWCSLALQSSHLFAFAVAGYHAHALTSVSLEHVHALALVLHAVAQFSHLMLLTALSYGYHLLTLTDARNLSWIITVSVLAWIAIFMSSLRIVFVLSRMCTYVVLHAECVATMRRSRLFPGMKRRGYVLSVVDTTLFVWMLFPLVVVPLTNHALPRWGRVVTHVMERGVFFVCFSLLVWALRLDAVRELYGDASVVGGGKFGIEANPGDGDGGDDGEVGAGKPPKATTTHPSTFPTPDELGSLLDRGAGAGAKQRKPSTSSSTLRRKALPPQSLFSSSRSGESSQGEESADAHHKTVTL